MSEEPKTNEVAVPVIEETLVIGRREVKTGSVRVRKRVERIRKTVDLPLVKDVVEVQRIPINKVVKEIPEVREERGTLVIPVVEEEIEVRRRLVLKEEIHVVRNRIEQHAATEVSVAREHAIIERLDAEGTVIARSDPVDENKRSICQWPEVTSAGERP